jgi:hypothetical protein
MPTPTTTYSFSKPTVGGDDNAWGTELNANLDKLDDLLDGTLSIAPNLVGWEVGGVAVTASAAELNILDGVTASTAELNILDGVTASTAEINLLDGVTYTLTDLNSLTASVAELNVLDGITATTAELNVLDGIAGIASQVEAEAGTATDKLMTPERTKQAIDALVPVLFNATGSAPLYACRAWVNFNGTVSAASMIRASGNVSSITDNGTGNYTVNLTTAMSAANYSVVATAGDNSLNRLAAQVSDLTTSSFRIYVLNHGNAFLQDATWVTASIFR